MSEINYLNRMKQIHSFNNDPRMNEVRDFYNTPSFWQIMNIARRENSHSAFISYYLNPNNHHSLGDSFLKLFLQMVVIRAIEQKKDIDDDFAQKIMLSSTILTSYMRPEEFMQMNGEKGRFDIFMKCLIPANANGKISDNNEDEEFIVIIENKVTAKETKNKAGRGQTAKYKEYINEHYPDQQHLMILLSPDSGKDISEGKGVKIDCEDFIRVTYQDLLDKVIEPVIGNHIPNQEDLIRLKDYVKCLSIPALEEGTNNENSKSIIMATSDKETKLLMDFWNNNEDLIKACLSVIAGNEEFSEEARKIASEASTANFQRDTTKYRIGTDVNSKESRSSLVPVFVKKWALKNNLDKRSTPEEVLEDLIAAFPSTLRGGKNSKEEIVYLEQPQAYRERNYPAIAIGPHTIYVAANIWTKDRFEKFLYNAEKLAQGDPNLQITEV